MCLPPETTAGVVDSRTGRLFPIRKHARLTAEYWTAVLCRLETAPAKIVAYEMGLSWPALRMRLARAGLRVKPQDAEGMPPRMSQVVAMRREGKKNVEIARVMGITADAVGVYLYQARQRGIAV